jgi:hypothetical protein
MFIVTLFSLKFNNCINPAYIVSEVLLAKLPEQFSVHFRREGVLHQVCNA